MVESAMIGGDSEGVNEIGERAKKQCQNRER